MTFAYNNSTHKLAINGKVQILDLSDCKRLIFKAWIPPKPMQRREGANSYQDIPSRFGDRTEPYWAK